MSMPQSLLANHASLNLLIHRFRIPFALVVIALCHSVARAEVAGMPGMEIGLPFLDYCIIKPNGALNYWKNDGKCIKSAIEQMARVSDIRIVAFEMKEIKFGRKVDTLVGKLSQPVEVSASLYQLEASELENSLNADFPELLENIDEAMSYSRFVKTADANLVGPQCSFTELTGQVALGEFRRFKFHCEDVRRWWGGIDSTNRGELSIEILSRELPFKWIVEHIRAGSQSNSQSRPRAEGRRTETYPHNIPQY